MGFYWLIVLVDYLIDCVGLKHWIELPVKREIFKERTSPRHYGGFDRTLNLQIEYQQ